MDIRLAAMAKGLALGVSFSLSLVALDTDASLADPLVLAPIDCLRAASVAGGDERRFVDAAVPDRSVEGLLATVPVVVVVVARARTGGLVTEAVEARGETFFTVVDAEGVSPMLTRVLFPRAILPPVDAAELLLDLSMSDKEEGGRLTPSDIDEAGRDGKGVLKAEESRRPPTRVGAARVAPAVPLTPMLLLSWRITSATSKENERGAQ
jgi:hypothetical protein